MKTKQLQITVAWMVIATLMIGIAFWQAQVAVARDLTALRQAPPPPTRTRHAVRPPPATLTGDPVANYVARCQKGMTRQEIGWILEDYRIAGLNLDWNAPDVTETQLFALRAAQQRWYRGILIEVFQLDAGQAAEITAKLAIILTAAEERFRLAEKAAEPTARYQLVDPDWMKRNQITDYTAIDLDFQPENLCQLDEAQLRLLKPEGIGEVEDSLRADFLPLLKSQVVTYSDPLIDPEQPFRGYDLPLMGSPESSAREVDQVLALQPAQLKLRLLRSPGMTRWLQKALDRDSK